MTHHRWKLVLPALVALAAGGLAGLPEAAEPVKATVNPAVTANDDFALDLYRQIIKEKAGKNVFFSPWSMSVALAMTAEGARGETALQMGRVLRFPASLRRGGADAETLPWDLGELHRGMAALLARFNTTKPVPKEILDQITRLREELKKTNEQAARLQKAGKFIEAQDAAQKSQKLAGELNKLLARVDQYELRVANALWAEKTYPFQDSYLQTIRTHYGTGAAFPVDFVHDAEGVRQRINGWVEERTRNRIKNLIPPKAVDEYTRLVLTNAIYFKGEWADPFDSRLTKDEPFFAAGGKKVPVPLMHAQGVKSVRYAAFNGDGTPFDTPLRIGFSDNDEKFYPDRKGFVALEIPYKGDELSMVVLVPRAEGGLQSLEKLLTAANLQTWTTRLQQRAVNVFLPRYKLETDYEMGPLLQSLGMVRAFVDPREPNGAQFDGMSLSRNPANKLYITKVLHKAFVEVNEKGTEAAAATAVIMARPTSAPATRPFVPTVRADRPFVFLIRDRKTGCMLFLGRVTDPKG
jgi:serine protease inhibitor